MVDAQEGACAGRLGLQARAVAGIVFRLAHMHQRAQRQRLLLGAGVDGDNRNALVDRRADRTRKHVEIGNRHDDPIGVRGRRLLHYARHIRQIAGRRVAVFHGDIHLLGGQLDGVLDRVPPAVAVRSMTDQNVSLTLGQGRRCNQANGDSRRCQSGKRLFHLLPP